MLSSRQYFTLLAGVGLGAAGMYILDPQQGARRRALARDRAAHAGRQTGRWSLRKSRNLLNRAGGQFAELRSRWRGGKIDDAELADRVRAHLGHVVSHPGALEVAANGGRVSVSGPVLEGEAERIATRLRKIHGVNACELRVETHAAAGNIPALQGKSRFEQRQSVA